jgi:hypothetical protein
MVGNELSYTAALLLPIGLNVVPADSHVGEIERSIRTVKERLRSCARIAFIYTASPTHDCPHGVQHDALFEPVPVDTGISDTMSPNAISSAPPFPISTVCASSSAHTCSCSKTTRHPTPSNLLSVGAIALSPTGNAQGDYFFTSLATGNTFVLVWRYP